MNLKSLLFAILLSTVVCFIGCAQNTGIDSRMMSTEGYPIPEGFIAVAVGCYLEIANDADGNPTEYAHLHFRGKIFEGPTMQALHAAIFSIEGVAGIFPRPYDWTITRGKLYSWDELVKLMGEAVTKYRKDVETLQKTLDESIREQEHQQQKDREGST